MAVGFQEDDQLDDATRAFDDLRAEVAVLRRAVEALDAIVDGWRRAEAAGEELKGCYEAARKSGKDQRCSVVIKVPVQ